MHQTIKNFCRLVVLFVATTASANSAVLDPAEEVLAKAAALQAQKQYGQAIELLLPYARSKQPELLVALALSYMLKATDGKGEKEIQPAEIQMAIDTAERAAAHGSAGAYNLLYMMTADPAKALRYLRRGVEHGDQGAKLNYSIMLYQGSDLVEQDLENACPLILELAKAEKPDSAAGYYLGIITFRGQCGLQADSIAGVHLIRTAADHGLRDAERDMGKNYEFAWSGPADLHKALGWYAKAAEHGEPHAQWRVGMAYVKGEGREKDSAKAVQYFKNAAASEHSNGLASLAVMYVTGDGVAQDFIKARKLYQQAAERGNTRAYAALAIMYLNGEGVTADPVRARVLYSQSVELGNPENPAFRQKIESMMDAGQLKTSDRQLESWRAERQAK